MATGRSDGSSGNGADSPAWARDLSAEVRAVLRRGEARDAQHAADMAEFARRADENRKRADEDRKRADEDRKRFDARLEESIRRADETAARYHQETVAALQGAAKVGKLIRQDIRELGQSIRKDIHGLIQSVDHLARVMRGRSNGQGGGNGRRFKA